MLQEHALAHDATMILCVLENMPRLHQDYDTRETPIVRLASEHFVKGSWGNHTNYSGKT